MRARECDNRPPGKGRPSPGREGSLAWRLAALACAALLFLAAAGTPLAAPSVPDALAGRVAALGLGFGGFVLGDPLSSGQWQAAQEQLLDGSYPGTVRFPAEEEGLVVVAEATPPHRVLAIYQRREEAGRAEARRMVARLMDRFGEPTTMAHDRMVYWAYDAGGKISEERLDAARRGDAGIQVLATVKLHSDLPIAGDSDGGGEGGEGSGSLYFILSSPALSGRLVRP